MTPALWGFAAALCWGTTEYVARVSGRGIGPTNSLLGTLVVSSIAVTLWIWIDGSPLVWRADGIHWLILTGIGFAAGLLLLFASLTRGPVSVASPVVSSYPAFVVVGALALGIIPTLLQTATIVAILIGVLIVAGNAHPEENGDHAAAADRRVWPTVALGVASAVVFELGVIAGRQAAEIYGELQALWLNRLVALSSLALFMLVTRTRVGLPRRWRPAFAAMGALDTLGVLAILLGTAGEGAAVAAAASAPVAVVTTLLAATLLRERVPMIQWFGIAVVVAGAGALAYYG
ncbi:MAG: DMT family transporter [Proteobacteria bacterium]|nr:DMT family transporter [Pseudomonadota bacterium]